jgi:hypothetical protein
MSEHGMRHTEGSDHLDHDQLAAKFRKVELQKLKGGTSQRVTGRQVPAALRSMFEST